MELGCGWGYLPLSLSGGVVEWGNQPGKGKGVYLLALLKLR